jgi:hypothetical protein
MKDQGSRLDSERFPILAIRSKIYGQELVTRRTSQIRTSADQWPGFKIVNGYFCSNLNHTLLI